MIDSVTDYFLGLQTAICNKLAQLDGVAEFSKEPTPAPNGGFAQPRVLVDGRHLEKAAVQYSHSIGESLPPAATERNPHLAGHRFQAAAISMIVHPQNPYVPITHMNLRFFLVESQTPVWYFGGGFDLTPCYPFIEDVVHWHSMAQTAAGEHYAALKQQCDEYFYLPHRDESRGVGGLFFDDWTVGGFDTSFDFVQRIGNAFLPAYEPIVRKRMGHPFDDSQREFQLYRRGRYAEFNLAIDRGTKYGLQSGRRVESVLASLPPLVKWIYNYQPSEDSPEARLGDFLKPREWL